jgi:Mce-associated membrane protein
VITGGQHDDDQRDPASAPEAPSSLALDGRLDPESDGPDHAHWGRRVVAALLDGGLLGLITWLAFPVQPVVAPLPTALGASGTTAPVTAGVWTSSPVVIGAVVVVVLMQAYLGSTPGKLAVGIALVRADDHRPVGLLRMLGREVMHVVDLLLLIGYLRPWWHRRRQTFADSIAATVVLRTRAPLPFVLARPVLDRGAIHADGAPWQLPSTPRRRTVTTAVATVACLAGVVFAVGGESGRGGAVGASCTVVDPRTGALQLTGIDVEVRGRETRTRLGLTRALVPENPGVVVGWDWYGEWTSDDDLRYRVTVRDESGTERVWQYAYRGDGLQVPPGQQRVPDRTDAVLIPPAALEGLGDEVTVEADAVLDGAPLPGCTVETTLAPTR